MKLAFAITAAALLATSGIASADQKLAQSKACLSCHQIDKKVMGPAFKEIAKKYKGDAAAVAHLETVAQKGGKGNWGAVPMPPQPQVSADEAKKLVAWVLSL
jgi:cytochrome c